METGTTIKVVVRNSNNYRLTCPSWQTSNETRELTQKHVVLELVNSAGVGSVQAKEWYGLATVNKPGFKFNSFKTLVVHPLNWYWFQWTFWDQGNVPTLPATPGERVERIAIRCHFCDVRLVTLIVKSGFSHKQYVKVIVRDEIVNLQSFVSTWLGVCMLKLKESTGAGAWITSKWG